MSRSTGKTKAFGITVDFVYFKYHGPTEDMDTVRFMVIRSNPTARWFYDYQEMVHNEEFMAPVSV